jgi:DNA adenine methylase
MLRASKALAIAEFMTCDFEDAIDKAEPGDWVYLDPPYVPLGGWADFKRYTPGQFGEDDHERLYHAMMRANTRGVFVMLTNSDTPFVRGLFGSPFHIFQLTTRRDINLQTAKRKSSDLVVTNYEPQITTQELLFD